MTDKTRIRIEIGLIATLVSAAAGGGAGWATKQAELTALKATQDSTAAKVDRIDRRIAEMYCAQVPPEKRPGCR